MNESIEKFRSYAAQIEDFASVTKVPRTVVADFSRRLEAARRIYVTGTGTSLPTALYLASKLQEKYDKLVVFLPTAKMIRQASKLKNDDLVIMISHGFNRADALIIYEAVNGRSDTIIISGNVKAEINSHTLLVTVPPAVEKIFCRPISPVTTLLAIRQLLGDQASYKPREIPDIKTLSSWIDPVKQTVLLYTADVSYAAELWGIVLREGAGLNVMTKDIENYSHGYYGVDTADLDNRQFIILSSDSDLDSKDLDRASGLYNIPGFNKYILTAPGHEFEANLALFVAATEVVGNIISRTNRDMDHPNGMEENRKYHEYDRYKNYIAN